MKAIERLFSPEFRNRMDSVIQFKPLNIEIIGQVVDKLIFELEAQLAEKSVSIVLEPEARQWLAEHGFDPRMGARPMARVIQENIKKPLAEEILFGTLKAGGIVRIALDSDTTGLSLVVENAQQTAEAV
jgi:ATP-dependent Clp protease ATP-binding subunit ClpA